MAATCHISNAAAKVAVDALLALLNAGSGPAILRLYTGTMPADVDTAVTVQTLLGTLTFSDPAFAAAADSNPGARATANSITADTVADATGTATWFRVLDSNGLAIIDGNVGVSDEALVLNTAAIVAGAEIDVTQYLFNLAES